MTRLAPRFLILGLVLWSVPGADLRADGVPRNECFPVEQLDPKFIIPGHGKASTQALEAIAFTRDYIRYVRSAMATAVKDWTDFDAAYEKTDWSKYRDMLAFAANNRGNAYRIYLELEQSQFKADKQ